MTTSTIRKNAILASLVRRAMHPLAAAALVGCTLGKARAWRKALKGVEAQVRHPGEILAKGKPGIVRTLVNVYGMGPAMVAALLDMPCHVVVRIATQNRCGGQ